MASLVPTSPAALVSRYDDPGIIDTIRNTVAKGANDSELRMFLEVCKATGLNPFLKEIWYVAATKTIMAGRDGYLRKANEDPFFDGMETRVERDANNIPVKAICTVWRKDRAHPIICEAYYSEYKKAGNVWNQYPSAMIAKVAEVLALKRSFSINGVVTQEEIGEEDTPLRGSKEAAQAIAQQKIAQIDKDRIAREAAAKVVEPHYAVVPDEPPIPEPHFIDPDEPRPVFNDEPGLQPPHDAELRDSIKEFGVRPTKKSPKKIDMLKAFGELKKGFANIKRVDIYYATLGAYGAVHSSDFPDSPGGLKQARECYKEMSLAYGDASAEAAIKPA